ncbi:hypothetical protein SAMN05216548_101114 [Faunimonas pinastri]|uniref:Aminoglycoside phosphotransferase domain-containing protein n=1 Tax=Faunimonas pinastri TaxID=1855383 RepID=A0A1H8ZCR4_9HYPH|nr:hypothetical protein [Faunimonas pinastri]SEP62182.1 hypothetical protein SAMN05216548_101114 [Faunimonas pinastri]
MPDASAAPAEQGGPAARALSLAKQGRFDEAGAILCRLVAEEFALEPVSLEISRDGYSLNSVNGFLQTATGEDFFFKFHHEEGEEQTLKEFYQAELLRDAGYPVDAPVFASRELGRQILLYKRRSTPRFADLCRELDGATSDVDMAPALRAQADLDDLTAAIYRRTLHRATDEEIAREPIHQLFHTRLIDPDRPDKLGGRARRFFFDRDFDLAGTVISADELRAARWIINGVSYRQTLGELLEKSRQVLAPERLGRFGALVAHGDAHNANVWWEEEGGKPRLVLFDPAFAGSHVPAILAEVKATFHNILAHPAWLYHADEAAQRFGATVTYRDGVLDLRTDWRSSPLRQGFLRSKAERLWRPLLAEMSARDLLPDDWRQTLRSALFCCPTLVMDLAAGGTGRHNPVSSTIGLSVAIMAGSEPESGGKDLVSAFLDAVKPGRD